MSDPTTAPQETIVPVKVSAPADHAPPSLAEPASGAAAEISGAVTDEAGSATEAKPVDVANINGAASSTETAADKPATTESSKPSEPAPAADEDTEMKDDSQLETEDKPSTSNAAAETNGASASKPKRKSSTGVPEHRSKTLKKKQSKQKITNLDAKPGDYYLARLRSFPPWPSVICDEDMLPEVLLKTRPVTAMQQDGTYKEPYVDDGKKVMDRTFAVMFLQTNEFGWIPNTDLTPLEPEQCKDVTEKGKTKSLIEAYKIAAEGHELQHFKDMLMQHEAAIQEDEERKAQREAEKTAKADKKKRKSEVKQDEDVEMQDAEEVAPKKSSKKRKKDAESDDEETEKPAKTPKTTKLKLTTGKTPTTDKKTTEKKTPKPKSEKKKKAAAESSDDVEPEKEEEPPLDPIAAREARKKEVLFLRHKLQKGFLSRDVPPQDDEMPQMNTYIKKLEAYGDKIEVTVIRSTKINKVLKALVKLNTIPKDEEYHFRQRAIELLGLWNPLLGAEPADDKPSKDDKDDKEDNASPTTTNGVHKEAEKEIEEKTGEKVEKEVEEPKENTLPAQEAVDKISDEVAADAGAKSEAIDAIQKDEKPAEEAKTEAPSAPVTEKAPESAAGAAEAAAVVKATE